MWLKLWEKMRGYDKWTAAEATVQAPDSVKIARMDAVRTSSWDGDVLVWLDHQGAQHCADFMVPEDCTLYQKVAGDTLTIRYNPRNPGQFYFRQLHQVRVRAAVKRILIAVSIVGLVVMALWVREKP